MDSLTQIVLGGAVGEAVLGKKVGNKAVLWGAIGGTIPDLDTIPGIFLDTVSGLDMHRGFSHSIIFALLISPLLGYLIFNIYKKKKEETIWGWTQLFFWAIFTHPLLDIFTTWGTQLFWPSDWRVAIQSIFVIDPLYTLPFLVCLLAVLFTKRNNPKRKKWNKLGLIISTAYLALTVVLKLYVNAVFESSLKADHPEYIQYESRPSLANTILWTANVELEKEFLVTYYSLFDGDRKLNYASFLKNEELLNPYRNDPKIERLIFLTKGYYTIEKTKKGIAMNDLRFGLTEGFDNGKGTFVFSYFIYYKNGEVVVEQKERDLKGAKASLEKLWKRILGEEF